MAQATHSVSEPFNCPKLGASCLVTWKMLAHRNSRGQVDKVIDKDFECDSSPECGVEVDGRFNRKLCAHPIARRVAGGG